jgi:hypothetical protein
MKLGKIFGSYTVIMGLAASAQVICIAVNWDHPRTWVINGGALVAIILFWCWARARSRRADRVVESIFAPRPLGVKVVRADGSVLPCELAYVGNDTEHEAYVWEIAGAVLFPGDHVEVDVMPPHTGIQWRGSRAGRGE